jgi:soluble cytochrome b562
MISKKGALRMMRERNLDIARKKLTEDPSFGEGVYAEMEILNQADKQKLKGFLSEAVASLQTIADEREHYKDIADRVEDDLGIDKKIFKKTATLVHNGKLEEVKQLHEDADDLYSQVSTVI